MPTLLPPALTLLLLLLSASAAADAPCPPANEVAPGVFIVPGAEGPPSPANGGAVANRSFLLGDGGVIVIDPGPPGPPADALRCAIARQGAGPILAIVNTHPHPENVLANAEFAGLPIYASDQAKAAMRERCRDCRARFLAATDNDPSSGDESEMLLPSHPISARTTLRLAGRRLTLLPLGSAHSPGDLAVIDHASATLFAGDVGNDRLPDLHDGSAADAQSAIAQLLAEPGIARVVPGRGQEFPPTRLRQPAAYLAELRRYALRRLDEADGFVPPAELPAELAQYYADEPERHWLNLQRALREAEEAWWQAGSPK